MNSQHNQVESIARFVCNYCLANRSLFGTPPYRELFPTTERVEKSYQFLYMWGGRRRFTEPKKSALLRAHLFTIEYFQMVAPNIELMCRFKDGVVRYWNGNGTRKDVCIEDMAERWQMIDDMIGGGTNQIPFMEYQVDITNIWNEISPYLES
jgi:hypothetical protein